MHCVSARGSTHLYNQSSPIINQWIGNPAEYHLEPHCEFAILCFDTCECIIHTATQGGNVSQYMIKSISGMNIFTSQASVQIFCVAMSCVYSQVVKTTGIPYSITISSINDGGVGPESDPIQGIINVC